MKKPFALLTCSALALSGCQMISESHDVHTTTTYSDLWTSAEVAADENIHSAAPAVNPDADPNRILTSKTESGNREYLFADSVKQENGKVMALIEYRYAQTQKLPANGLPYTHNHWFEEIDCANKIRTVRTTTHYNSQGDIVDANEYPAPKLSPAQMKLLAQPDDGVIKEVCQRVGGASAPTVSGSPESNPTTHTPTVSGSPQPNQNHDVNVNAAQATVSGSPASETPSAQAASEVIVAPPAKENAPESPSQQKRNKKDKTQKATPKPAEQPEKPATEIDFIQQGKQQNAPAALPENDNVERQTVPQNPTIQNQNDDEPTLAPMKAAPQQDDLPADFWTIGAPKE